MGGQNEFTIQPKKVPGHEVVAGALRVHENKGQVHFHDDKANLKAAVPVDRWYAAWDKLRTEPGTWRFYDTEFGSVLSVQTSVTKGKFGTKPPKIEVFMSLEKANATPEYAALDTFTNG